MIGGELFYLVFDTSIDISRGIFAYLVALLTKIISSCLYFESWFSSIQPTFWFQSYCSFSISIH